MRAEATLGVLLGVALLLRAGAALAAEPAPPPRPEEQLRPLPNDTFKPSEEIPEDYPVAFPVDV